MGEADMRFELGSDIYSEVMRDMNDIQLTAKTDKSHRSILKDTRRRSKSRERRRDGSESEDDREVSNFFTDPNASRGHHGKKSGHVSPGLELSTPRIEVDENGQLFCASDKPFQKEKE